MLRVNRQKEQRRKFTIEKNHKCFTSSDIPETKTFKRALAEQPTN